MKSLPRMLATSMRAVLPIAVGLSMLATPLGASAQAAPPNGAEFSISGGSQLPDTQDHYCPPYYLCLYSEQGYKGEFLSLSRCEFKDLGKVPFPAGGYWNDKMSSYFNNQVGHVHATFYNWSGSAWIPVGDSVAPMAQSAPSFNNIVDAVRVC
ncbi:peptidase inhibitor family I36 protein [Micromonospora sp. NPDC050397]|uniref:peptidase inhibitor family I36 protein n=1 Tax=Micromonospora sp. NPDC050397 TaxID=3364279 RepID=UPI00384EEA54